MPPGPKRKKAKASTRRPARRPPATNGAPARGPLATCATDHPEQTEGARARAGALDLPFTLLGRGFQLAAIGEARHAFE